MLGAVYLAPDGNNKDHVSYIRQKAEHWADNIKSNPVNKEEVWTALHRTIPFAMAYSLPATTLTQEECTFVMAPIYKTGLSKAGIASTISSAVRSGPLENGGLGLLDAYIHLGVSKVKTLLLTNIWQRTPTGMLLEMALDDLEIGLPNTWQSTSLQLGLLYVRTHTWIRHLLQFTVESKIELKLDRDLYSPRREHDKTIMEAALEYSRNRQILKSINAVRMSLKVVWMSDIASADGTFLDSRCLISGVVFPRRNDYTWPHKHHTTPKDWTVWWSWLSSIYQGTR
jgi:hypothetical protein